MLLIQGYASEKLLFGSSGVICIFITLFLVIESNTTFSLQIQLIKTQNCNTRNKLSLYVASFSSCSVYGIRM